MGKKNKLTFNLHGYIPRSSVNGPGERFVIFTQGCSRLCPGCNNIDALPHEPHMLMTVDELYDKVISTGGIEGVTFSGGEPLEQIDACLELCRRLRSGSGLSVLVYSGYNPDEIRAMPLGGELLNNIDVLVAGPFIEKLRCESGIAGSSNQGIIFLTKRYTMNDIEHQDDFEIFVYRDGHIVMTGILPDGDIL
jgi:anaerobic ribonucleoside-triphosphate reductase activating protein